MKLGGSGGRRKGFWVFLVFIFILFFIFLNRVNIIIFLMYKKYIFLPRGCHISTNVAAMSDI